MANFDLGARTVPEETSCWPPIPRTERGFNLHLGTTSKKGNWVAYPNGRFVFLRDLDNWTQCRVFSEHKSKVNVAKFHPKGNYVASGDDGGNVVIWEILSNRFSLRKSFPVCKKVTDLAWDADGKRIAVCGHNEGKNFQSVITADSGNTIGTISGHSANVLSIDYRHSRPYRIASGGEDTTVCFFEGPPFKFKSSFTDHTNYVQCVRFSPDGSQFFSVGNGEVFLYDGKTGVKTGTLKQGGKKSKHAGTIYSACWSADGKQILTAGADKTCKLWNVVEKEGNSGGASTLAQTIAFGNDKLDFQISSAVCASKMMSVSLSGAINFLNGEDGTFTSTHGLMKNVNASALDREGKVLYTGELNGNLLRWDLTTGVGTWFSGAVLDKPINALRVSGSSVIATNTDDKLRIHDASGVKADDKKDAPVVVGGAVRELVSANNDASLSAAVTAQGDLIVFKDNAIVSKTACGFEPKCCAFSADDATIYVGGKNKALHHFAVDSAGAVTKTDVSWAMTADCEKVAVSADGKYVCGADSKKSILFFNVGGEEALNLSEPFRYHNSTVRDLKYSPDGSKVASASVDSNIIIWYEGESGKRCKWEASFAGVDHIHWLDETTLIAINSELTIKTWTVPAAWSA